MNSKEEFFQRFEQFKKQEISEKKAFDNIANIRLVIIIVGIVSNIAIYIRSPRQNFLISASIFLLALTFIIIKHIKIKKRLIKLQAMIEVNSRFLQRMDGSWTSFQDSGEDFMDSNHPYSSDLDVFGPKSLFQWISVANSFYGRRGLKVLLEKSNNSLTEINERQGAVKELSKKIDFCQQLQCQGIITKDIAKDPTKLLEYAEDTTILFKIGWIKAGFYLLPFILVLSLVLIFTGSSISIYFPISIAIFHLGINIAGFRKTSSILSAVYGFNKNLEAYKNILLLIEGEGVEADYLKHIKENVSTNGRKGSEAMKILEGISNSIDLKYSPLVHFILNIVFLWDYHQVFKMEAWRKEYGGGIRRIIEVIGEYEALSSLAVIHQINPHWTFPDFTKEKLTISATEMGHPLLRPDICICNNIALIDNSCIITGSNMSGKTTLLRTIGINLVLAYAGGPVFAKEFKASIMDIYTSMRNSDDLNSGISTFYAELLRIKMIIDHSKNHRPLIYLIDEMFRGTNSKDRIIGARSVLKNLNKAWVIGLISTHDLELCDLELDDKLRVKNYHFTEHYEDNKIQFDYKLKVGSCKTTNAKHLMKMVGISLEEE